jgi:nucleoside-diphosphate-sugar epimerase
LLHSYHAAYGFNVTMFRYFNPYGPDEQHEPETHAIPNFIRAALDGTPVPLYWKGEPIRDFFFVDDIARAHVMGLDRDGYNVYNLGSGNGVKVGDVVETIFEITGSRSEIADLGERPGDPMQLFADTTRANEELGWKPEVSIEEGLRQTVEAFKTRK